MRVLVEISLILLNLLDKVRLSEKSVDTLIGKRMAKICTAAEPFLDGQGVFCHCLESFVSLLKEVV
jgi:hypothetical protein